MTDKVVVCVTIEQGAAKARDEAGNIATLPVTTKLRERMGDMARRFFFATPCPVNGLKLGKYAPYPSWA